jgi:gamma-glutamylcyclotransferase (GGCT)/AIG2-like uncharacterized protein YtfP
MKYKIFVYGTLRTNFPNNHFLNTSTKLGDAVTVEKYGLLANGIPFLVEDLKRCSVVGELWEVSKLTLKKIDLLEGYNETSLIDSWYVRKEIEVIVNGKIESAEAYFIPNKFLNFEDENLKVIGTGDYADYYKILKDEI